jgi:hypothetical protein
MGLTVCMKARRCGCAARCRSHSRSCACRSHAHSASMRPQRVHRQESRELPRRAMALVPFRSSSKASQRSAPLADTSSLARVAVVGVVAGAFASVGSLAADSLTARWQLRLGELLAFPVSWPMTLHPAGGHIWVGAPKLRSAATSASLNVRRGGRSSGARTPRVRRACLRIAPRTRTRTRTRRRRPSLNCSRQRSSHARRRLRILVASRRLSAR